MARELKQKDVVVNGKVRTFTFLSTQDAVAVLPLTDNEDVVFVEQLRPVINKHILELPAGLIEINEAPESAALRELKEETGYTAQSIEYMGYIYTSPGITTEKIHLFKALVQTRGQQSLDEGESINVRILDKLELKELISKQQIVDGKTMVLLGLGKLL